MERNIAPRCINSTTKTHVCNAKDNQKALTVKKPDQALADYSPKDANWDGERAITQLMSEFLFEMERYERWAERMDGCTRTLRFGELVNMETGEINPKLVNAFSAIVAIAVYVMGVKRWYVWGGSSSNCLRLSRSTLKPAGYC